MSQFPTKKQAVSLLTVTVRTLSANHLFLDFIRSSAGKMPANRTQDACAPSPVDAGEDVRAPSGYRFFSITSISL